MDRKRHQLSMDESRAWQDLHEIFPGWRRRWELVAEYARKQGGLTLRFWNLKCGPAFGSRRWLSVEQCAHALKVPVSDLAQIRADTYAWVRPRLHADPSWQEMQSEFRKRGSHAMLKHARKNRRRLHAERR